MLLHQQLVEPGLLVRLQELDPHVIQYLLLAGNGTTKARFDFTHPPTT